MSGPEKREEDLAAVGLDDVDPDKVCWRCEAQEVDFDLGSDICVGCTKEHYGYDPTNAEERAAEDVRVKEEEIKRIKRDKARG